MERLRVVLADDHAVVREGLTLLINGEPDMNVVAQAPSGRELLQVLENTRADVVVLDVSMPRLNGVQAAEQIRRRFPDVRVLGLTRHDDPGYVRRMLHAGATGYLLKKTVADVLLVAIRAVAAGGTYVDPTLAGGILANAAPTRKAAAASRLEANLSAREAEVLRLLAWGHSYKEIAAQLAIRIKTAESYKASAAEKLGLHSRSDIVRYALSEGWLSDDSALE